MKKVTIFEVLRWLLAIAGVVFLFINWRIAIALFLIDSIVMVIPRGPNALLSVLTGDFIIGGIVCLFFNWKIGIGLIVVGFIVAKFRVWGNRKNAEYYKENNEPQGGE
jgi:hypothetical protein